MTAASTRGWRGPQASESAGSSGDGAPSLGRHQPADGPEPRHAIGHGLDDHQHGDRQHVPHAPHTDVHNSNPRKTATALIAQDLAFERQLVRNGSEQNEAANGVGSEHRPRHAQDAACATARAPDTYRRRSGSIQLPARGASGPDRRGRCLLVAYRPSLRPLDDLTSRLQPPSVSPRSRRAFPHVVRPVLRSSLSAHKPCCCCPRRPSV